MPVPELPHWACPPTVAFVAHQTVGTVLAGLSHSAVQGGHGEAPPTCASTLTCPSCQGAEHDPRVWSRNNRGGVLALPQRPPYLLVVESPQGGEKALMALGHQSSLGIWLNFLSFLSKVSYTLEQSHKRADGDGMRRTRIWKEPLQLSLRTVVLLATVCLIRHSP